MVPDIRPKLAEKIKWYRERAGMSQRALADVLKVDKGTIWRAEQGDSWPDYKTLEGIAGALGVEVEALFSWAAPSPTDAIRVLSELAARAPTDPLAARIARIEDLAGRRAIQDTLEDVEAELGLSASEAHERPGEKRK